MMGSPESEEGRRRREEAQHQVTIAPFAAAKFLVTVAQFRVFVEQARPRLSLNCNIRQVGLPGAPPTTIGYWERPGIPQEPNHPVVCVRWQDAQAYAAWLSERTGRRYRLLTEAEWEYAARGGTTTAFYWGDTEDHEFANTGNRCCYGYSQGRDKWDYTSPVDAFPPNPFGLYDMTGNASEWVEDCWTANSANARANGAAFTGSTCEEHVFRGGGWIGHTANSRIARRFHVPNERQLFDVGFRVARDLP